MLAVIILLARVHLPMNPCFSWPHPPIAVEADLGDEGIVRHHHGARPEEGLQIVGQLAPAWWDG
jgi:hypothetical protein